MKRNTSDRTSGGRDLERVNIDRYFSIKIKKTKHEFFDFVYFLFVSKREILIRMM